MKVPGGSLCPEHPSNALCGSLKRREWPPALEGLIVVSSAGCSAAGAVASIAVLDLSANRSHRHRVGPIPEPRRRCPSSSSNGLGATDGPPTSTSARFTPAIEDPRGHLDPERVMMVARGTYPEPPAAWCARRAHANHRDRDEQSASDTSGRLWGVFFNSCPQIARIGVKTGRSSMPPPHRERRAGRALILRRSR